MSDGEMASNDEQRVAFQVSNGQSNENALVLKPWGDVNPLLPRESYDVEFRGPIGGSPVIQVSDGYVTVFGWSGCVVKLYKDGAIVPGYERKPPPVPSIPDGMDMRQFVSMMFGQDARRQVEDSPDNRGDENT
jgi:hypothetical protein